MAGSGTVRPMGWLASGPAREGWFWLLALAAVRFGVMLAMGRLTGQRHFTDDWAGQMAFVEDPFQILLAREGGGAPYYPPLQPFLTFLAGYPLSRLLPSFYAVRCFSILYELAAWPVIWSLLNETVARQRVRRWLALGYVLMPVGWASTALFAQEEPISVLFLSAVMLLAVRGRIHAAILLASFGVVTAKIYFLVPLLALTVGPPIGAFRELIRRLALAAGPILAVYGIGVVALWLRGKPSPLIEFTPHGVHSTSIWVLIREGLGLSLRATKYLSMATGLMAGLIPLAAARLSRVRLEGLTLVKVMVAMQLFVYMWFYHCDPEYYLILAPGVLVSYPPVAALLGVVIGFTVPFVINLAYAVARASGEQLEPGKMVIVNLYARWVPLDARSLHTASVLALCAISLVMTCWLTARIARLRH